MPEFIFMLTRADVTISDAHEKLDDILQTAVQHIGFKDVGLDRPQMRKLVSRIHEAGRSAHLEVVSLTETDELNSVRAGVDLGVDYVLGGTRWTKGAEILRDSQIRYFPYPGRIEGHPARLRGTVDQIVEDAARMGSAVDGINLLAYRHETHDGADLLRQVRSKTESPVICAGSIDTVERVRAVAATGVWGFTIGTAALDSKLVPEPSLTAQINAVLEAADSVGPVLPSSQEGISR